jgi:hypothetical protein
MGAHKPTALFLYTDLKKEKSPLVNFEKSKFQHFNIIDLTIVIEPGNPTVPLWEKVASMTIFY